MLRRRKTLIWFSKKMEEILRKNDYKSGWHNCSYDFLFAKLNEETDELKRAIFKYLDYKDGYNEDLIANIIREAADVANIAMMIADNSNEKGKL